MLMEMHYISGICYITKDILHYGTGNTLSYVTEMNADRNMIY